MVQSAVGIKELRTFVAKLGGLKSQHKSLEIHIKVSQKIMASR